MAGLLLGCGIRGDTSPGGASSEEGGASTTDGTGQADTGIGVASNSGTSSSSVDETGADESTGGGSEDLVGSCDDVTLLPRPADTAAPGPWPVGVQTVDLDGLAVEVWYPAEALPDAGLDNVVYDVREALPASEQGKIPDDQNPWQPCDCFRDHPIDAEHGPYPVVVFVHGTAGFRTQSLPHMLHWASRGFVVMSADHPGLRMADVMGPLCGAPMVDRDLEGDIQRMLAAARGERSGLEALLDHIDGERVGLSGHSAGGGAVAPLGDLGQVIIPMAAGGVEAGSVLESSLVLGAVADSVVAFSSQVNGYDSSPSPKRLVGIANTGHLAFSQICSMTNDAGEDLLEIAEAHDVCGAQFAGLLFQCDDSFTPDRESWDIIHFASSAVLEETLHCEPLAVAGLAGIQDRFMTVEEFREAL